VEENGCDSQHLNKRVCLAEDAWPKLSPAYRRIENRGDDQDSNIPAKYKDGDSRGDQSVVRQHQKKRAQKKLVRNRVKVMAEHGSLLEDACERAIERIGKASGYEKSKAEGISALENCCHQKWGEADSKQREDIRSGSKWIQARI